MARAFQKRVGDYLRVRKEPHNAPWSVNDRHAAPVEPTICPAIFVKERSYRFRISELHQFPESAFGQSRVRWKNDRRCTLCIGLCASTEAPYVLDQLDRAIGDHADRLLYRKRATGEREILTNGRPIALVARMRQRTVCSRRRKGSASLSLTVCPNIGIVRREIQRGVHWFEEPTAAPSQHSPERSLVPSRKSCDSGDSSRPFFRVLS